MRLVGVDLGGTQLRAACVEPEGDIVRSRREPTAPDGPDAVLRQMVRMIEAVRDETTVAIGVGVPGSFDGATGTVLGVPALPGWGGVPLAATLTGATGLPCRLENDATAACFGEWRAGAGRGCEHFVFVTISTGIGAGVVVDGRVMRGARGLAGEIGHTRIADASDPCSCGQIGCWEAVASGTALGRRARREAEADPSGVIARLAGAEPVGARHVGLAARAGNEAALRLVREEAVWLGLGFINAQHLYAPERIVFGGGLSALLDLMAADIEAVMTARRLPGFPAIPVVPAALGDDAGLIGAALQAASFR